MNLLKRIFASVLSAINIFSASAKLPEAQVERNQTNPIETEYDSAKSNKKTILDKAYDNYLTSISDASEICNNVDIDKILSSMDTVLKERDRDEYNPNLDTIEAMTDTLKIISELKNDPTYNGIIYNDKHKQWELDVKNPDQYNITPNKYVRQYTAFIDLKYDDFMVDFVRVIMPIIFNYTNGDSNVTVDITPSSSAYIDGDNYMTITDVKNALLEQGYVIENTNYPNMGAIGNLGVSVSGKGIYEGHSYDDPEINQSIKEIGDYIRKKCNKITSQDPNKIMSLLAYLIPALAKENPKFKLLSYDLSNEAKANKISSGNRNASIYIIDDDEQSAYEEESPGKDNHLKFKKSIKAAETDQEKIQAALNKLHERSFGSHALDGVDKQK